MPFTWAARVEWYRLYLLLLVDKKFWSGQGLASRDVGSETAHKISPPKAGKGTARQQAGKFHLASLCQEGRQGLLVVLQGGRSRHGSVGDAPGQKHVESSGFWPQTTQGLHDKRLASCHTSSAFASSKCVLERSNLLAAVWSLPITPDIKLYQHSALPGTRTPPSYPSDPAALLPTAKPC